MITKANILTLALLSCVATTDALAEESECYDAEVSASIISQTPTVMPNCGEDCIIMRWPWILEIDVQDIHFGEVPTGPLMVLSVQHTDIRGDLGVLRWKLRHNAQGGLNAVGILGGGPQRHCSVDEEPARAFITPPTGDSLDDLLREGRQRYGRDN